MSTSVVLLLASYFHFNTSFEISIFEFGAASRDNKLLSVFPTGRLGFPFRPLNAMYVYNVFIDLCFTCLCCFV